MKIKPEIYQKHYKIKVTPGIHGRTHHSNTDPEDTIVEDLRDVCIDLGVKTRPPYNTIANFNFLWYNNGSLSKISVDSGGNSKEDHYARRIIVQTMPLGKSPPQGLTKLLEERGFKKILKKS